jgi:hypothetical protein
VTCFLVLGVLFVAAVMISSPSRRSIGYLSFIVMILNLDFLLIAVHSQIDARGKGKCSLQQQIALSTWYRECESIRC